MIPHRICALNVWQIANVLQDYAILHQKLVKKCSLNSDCLSGNVCDTSSGSCVACLQNSDCSSGQACKNSLCVTVPVPPANGSCSTTADCTGGLVCDTTHGKCKKKCSDHSQCGTNGACDFQGSSNGLPPYYCTGRQCTGDYQCIGSTCGSDQKCVL